MSPNENEPLPLCDPRSEDTAPLLRAALGAARDKLPTGDDLASIAAGLPLGGPGGSGPGPGPGAGGAAIAKVSLLPGVIAGAALGVFVSALSLVVAPADPPGVVAAASPGERPKPPLAPADPRRTPPLPAAPPSPPGPAALPAAPAGPSDPDASARAAIAPEDTPISARPGDGAAAQANAGSTTPADSAAGAAPEAGGETETEVELLKRARQALGSDAGAALALTVQHAARFPRGALGQEREVVAIQALVQLGRSGEARARADRFLAAHPGSAHRPGIEAAVGR